MSVTPDVSHIEIWPSMSTRRSSRPARASYRATAVLMLLSVITQIPGTMPHDADAHRVPSNALVRLTPSSTHQPKSWSKERAWVNIPVMSVTLWSAQLPRSRLKASAK